MKKAINVIWTMSVGAVSIGMMVAVMGAIVGLIIGPAVMCAQSSNNAWLVPYAVYPLAVAYAEGRDVLKRRAMMKAAER